MLVDDTDSLSVPGLPLRRHPTAAPPVYRADRPLHSVRGFPISEQLCHRGVRPFVNDGFMTSEFQWWAEIWIPAAVGVTTLGVSGIALWVSHRATVIARKVEDQRQAAEEERTSHELHRRLVGMAVEEARLLQRWVIEETQPGRFWMRTTPMNSAPPPRTEAEQARVDAYVALTQSLVPGADDLLRITSYDLDNLNRYISYDSHDADELNEKRADIRSQRVARATTRIRLWGLDPIGESAAVERELQSIDDSPAEYLMFGQIEIATDDEDQD